MKKLIGFLLMFNTIFCLAATAQKMTRSDTIKPRKVKIPVRHQRLPPRKELKLHDTIKPDTQKVNPDN